jgi:hypothetical protein
VAHPFHQLLEAGALRGRHRVPGVPQVVEVQFRQADRSPRVLPDSRKVDRRSRPPFGPMKTNPFGVGSAKRSRWWASSDIMSAGTPTVRAPARDFGSPSIAVSAGRVADTANWRTGDRVAEPQYAPRGRGQRYGVRARRACRTVRSHLVEQVEVFRATRRPPAPAADRRRGTLIPARVDLDLLGRGPTTRRGDRQPLEAVQHHDGEEATPPTGSRRLPITLGKCLDFAAWTAFMDKTGMTSVRCHSRRVALAARTNAASGGSSSRAGERARDQAGTSGRLNVARRSDVRAPIQVS